MADACYLRGFFGRWGIRPGKPALLHHGPGKLKTGGLGAIEVGPGPLAGNPSNSGRPALLQAAVRGVTSDLSPSGPMDLFGFFSFLFSQIFP